MTLIVLKIVCISYGVCLYGFLLLVERSRDLPWHN